MKIMRRGLALLMALLMCLGVLPGTGFAAEEPPVEGAEYTGTEGPAEEGENLVWGGSVSYVNPLYRDVLPEEEYFPAEEPLQLDGLSLEDGVVHCATLQEAAVYIRGKLVQRDPVITLAYSGPDYMTPELGDRVGYVYDMMDMAMEHTGVPTEGDYLLFQFGRWGADYWKAGDAMVISFNVEYFTSAAQEREMTSAASSVIAGLQLAGKNDYEAIGAIYDYVTTHVSYDYNHLGRSSYTLQYTAYGALIRGSAVCQGYAVLLYRLLLMAGFDCRVVTGTDRSGDNHAWNIVQMGYDYYYVDPTWDEGGSREYFLKASLPGHILSADYAGGRILGVPYVMAKSNYSPGESRNVLNTPRLQSAASEVGGVLVTWEAVPGAVNYCVMRRTQGGEFKAVAYTPETSYLDANAASGTYYEYTVVCCTADGSRSESYYNRGGLGIDYVAVPKLKSAAVTAEGIKLSWNAPAGAVMYQVFRRKDGGSWTAWWVTSDTSFTDKSVQSGSKYSYSVRCVDPDLDAFVSGFDSTGKTVTFIAAPTLVSVKNTAKGVKITWEASEGAVKYRVLRREKGSGWTNVGETAKTAFTDKTAQSGVKYTYSVRCITAKGKKASDCQAGLSIKYIAAPVLVSAKNSAAGKVRVTWEASEGAVKYRVLRKTEGGSWERLGNTAKTAYVDKTVEKGVTYYYTVRCISSTGKSYTSGYDTAGIMVTVTK